MAMKGAPAPAWSKDGAPDDTAADKQPANGDAGEKAAGLPLCKAAEVSQKVLQIPESVYGVASWCGVLYERQDIWDWFETCGCAYFLLLLNYVVQIGLLITVWQIHLWQHSRVKWTVQVKNGDTASLTANEEAAAECWHLAYFFYLFAQGIFISYVLAEMQGTHDQWEIIYEHLPIVSTGSEVLRFVKTDDGVKMVSGGLSRTRRTCILIFVVIPKFGIGIALIICGGCMLASSNSNTDLLLNSLAVNFIQDTDELIFSFLAPSHMRHAIQALPTFEVKSYRNVITKRLQLFTTIFKLIIIVAIAVIFYNVTENCPTDPCEYYPCVSIFNQMAGDAG